MIDFCIPISKDDQCAEDVAELFGAAEVERVKITDHPVDGLKDHLLNLCVYDESLDILKRKSKDVAVDDIDEDCRHYVSLLKTMIEKHPGK